MIVPDTELATRADERLPLSGKRVIEYWSDRWHDRTQLLEAVTAYLTERRWAKELGSGWEPWDLVVYCHSWTEVRVATVQEDHGGGKRLIRVRFAMWPRTPAKIAARSRSGCHRGAGDGARTVAGAALAGAGLVVAAAAWSLAAQRVARAVAVFDHAANKLGLFRCQPVADRDCSGRVG